MIIVGQAANIMCSWSRVWIGHKQIKKTKYV